MPNQDWAAFFKRLPARIVTWVTNMKNLHVLLRDRGSTFFPGFANSFLKQICQLTKTYTHTRKFPIFADVEADFLFFF